MSWESDIVELIRKQGAVNNTPGLQLGVMTGASSCKVGDLSLDADDLYFPDHLLIRVATKVRVSFDEHGVFHDETEYIEPLKAGDLVVLYRLSDTRYIVLGRVVAA